MNSSDLPSVKTKPVNVIVSYSDNSSDNDDFVDSNGRSVFVINGENVTEAVEEPFRGSWGAFRGMRGSNGGGVGSGEGNPQWKRERGPDGGCVVRLQGEGQEKEEGEKKSLDGGPPNPDPDSGPPPTPSPPSADWRTSLPPENVGISLPWLSPWSGRQEKANEEHPSGVERDASSVKKRRGGGGSRDNTDLYGASKPLPVGGFRGLSIDTMESLPFNVVRAPRNQKIVNINGEEKLIFTDIDKVKSKRRPGSGINVDGCSTLPMSSEYASLPASCDGTIPMGELPLPALDADAYCKLPKNTAHSSALSATASPKMSKKKRKRPPSHHHYIYGKKTTAAAEPMPSTSRVMSKDDENNIDIGEAIFDRGCYVKNMGCEEAEREFAKESDDEHLNESDPEHAYVLELKFGPNWRRIIRGKKMRKEDVRRELHLRDQIRASFMRQGLLECGLVEEADKIGEVIEFRDDDDESIRTAKRMMADFIPGMGLNPCTMVGIWREEGPPDYPFAQRGDFNTKNICQCWSCASIAVGGVLTQGAKGNLKKATKTKIKIESLFRELAAYRESSDEQNSDDEVRNGDSGFHF